MKIKANVINLDAPEFKESLAAMVAEGNKKSEKIMSKQKDIAELAKKILGYPGRMISGSKSGYHKFYPKNIPVFNSNLVTEKGKVWYGDIDITLDEDNIVKLAKKIGRTIYVLYEMDARFQNEDNPKLERAVLTASPTGEVTFFQYAERATRGKLKGKLIYKKEYQR